jgi:hypothetical protein
MKKILFVACLLVFSAFFAGTNANAFTILYDWQLDFNAVVPGLPTVQNIHHLNWDSPGVETTTITQYLGGDFTLGNGDLFTESGSMLLSSATKTAGNFPGTVGLNPMNDGSDDYYAFVVFENLTGSISDYDDQGTPFDPSDDTWVYTFDNGSGTIGIYLTTDPDPANATAGTQLVAGTIIPTSSGTADGFIGGPGIGDSNWGLTLEVTYLYPDLFLDSLGNSLNYLVDNGWLLALPQGVTNVDTVVYDPNINAYIFEGNTGDTMEIAAVPEPASLLLLGSGLLGLAVLARKKS